jgi:hypothetical protein
VSWLYKKGYLIGLARRIKVIFSRLEQRAISFHGGIAFIPHPIFAIEKDVTS